MTAPTIYEALKWASSFLENASREPKVAEILIMNELNMTKAHLISSLRDKMASETFCSYKAKIEQHARTGIPVQHITGKETFFDRTFQVNADVLIPRPETEELVYHVIQTVKKKGWSNFTCGDVGTGSGIIAITLALELGKRVDKMLATDISEKALAVARENADNLDAAVDFFQGNFLTPLIDQKVMIDILVSNPPYIDRNESEQMADTVKNFDPELALFAENNGLLAYETILEQAKSVLKEKAILAFEIGYQQGEAVSELIHSNFPKSDIHVLKDINGKDRIVIAEIENKN
ncbi:release factor glutamine methyltransferase [Gracilibacillus ureilyticus]|uniref:Release factor glutamine methyltransferase n=1 Tax=Gracilibacillus ureilyticus TaxID=531814 RepID=A0A1H9W2M0_9BACI|nr:peptide chain release factor N(5)-glutamine methyltransferase [Gracilibacillus ureilyticus]SES28098.1 release factor glutamine methyltransferase [Gracilibacillus ureilyticus]